MEISTATRSKVVGMVRKELAEIRKIEEESGDFGFYPIGSLEREWAKKFLARIQKNPELAAICRAIHEQNIIIKLCHKTFSRKPGEVIAGMIHINVQASDEDIINFLRT